MKKYISIAAILLLVGIGGTCSLTGCSTITNFVNDNQRIFDSSVRIAATKIINHDQGADLGRAQRMSDLATEIKSLALDERAPISIIEQAVRDNIRWEDYSEDEQILIDEFIRLVRSEIEARVEIGDLPEDYTFLVAHVADLVLEVTDRYL